MYSLTLADGTVLENLSVNGNNFISDDLVTEEMFTGNTYVMTVNDGENVTEYKNMALVYIQKNGDKYWFGFRERSAEELARIKMESDIAFIAMMTDVEL